MRLRTPTPIVAQTTQPSNPQDTALIQVLVGTALENAPGALAGILITFCILLVTIQRFGIIEYFTSITDKLGELEERLKGVERNVNDIREAQKEQDEKIWDAVTKKRW